MPHERVISTYGMSLPKFPSYPTTKSPIDPTIDDYEEQLEEKYPDLLQQTRSAYRATRKEIRSKAGLAEYIAPSMPRVTYPTRRVRR